MALEKELRGLVYLGAGRHAEGIALLREATTFEDGLAAEYGPPEIVKPTHELLGEVLLARGENAEAQKEFARALEMAPGRSLSLLGLARAARAAGDSAVAANAEAAAEEELGHRRRQRPRPLLTKRALNQGPRFASSLFPLPCSLPVPSSLVPLRSSLFPLPCSSSSSLFPLHSGLPTGTALPIVTAPHGAGSSTPTLTDVVLPTWKHAAAPSSSSAVSITSVHRDPVRFIAPSRWRCRPTPAA